MLNPSETSKKTGTSLKRAMLHPSEAMKKDGTSVSRAMLKLFEGPKSKKNNLDVFKQDV